MLYYVPYPKKRTRAVLLTAASMPGYAGSAPKVCDSPSHNNHCEILPVPGIPVPQRLPGGSAPGCSGTFPLWFRQDADGFFRTSMTSSFSPNCLRRVHLRLQFPDALLLPVLAARMSQLNSPEALSQLRRVSILIPYSLATSVG